METIGKKLKGLIQLLSIISATLLLSYYAGVISLVYGSPEQIEECKNSITPQKAAALSAQGLTIEEYCTALIGECDTSSVTAATKAAWAATGTTIIDYCESQKQMLDDCDKSDYSDVIAAVTDVNLVEYCQAQKQMLDKCDKSGFSSSYAAAQAAIGGTSTTLVKYCEAQKQMLDKCDKSGVSPATLAALGTTLVKYCTYQKHILDTKCSNVQLNGPEVASKASLWEKCKKVLMPSVLITKLTNSLGATTNNDVIFEDVYMGPSIAIFTVNIKTNSDKGVIRIDCQMDGQKIVNEKCGHIFDHSIYTGTYTLPPMLPKNGDLSALNEYNSQLYTADYLDTKGNELKELGLGEHTFSITVEDEFDGPFTSKYTWLVVHPETL